MASAVPNKANKMSGLQPLQEQWQPLLSIEIFFRGVREPKKSIQSQSTGVPHPFAFFLANGWETPRSNHKQAPGAPSIRSFIANGRETSKA